MGNDGAYCVLLLLFVLLLFQPFSSPHLSNLDGIVRTSWVFLIPFSSLFCSFSYCHPLPPLFFFIILEFGSWSLFCCFFFFFFFSIYHTNTDIPGARSREL